MADCDCGAPVEGKWADRHTAGCASLAREPSVTEIARIIGRTPHELDEGCDGSCDTDGGTCVCAELWEPVARQIIAAFAKARAA